MYRNLGYSSHDIISTMFRVTKTIPTLSEHSKLEFIKEIGFTHMRILEGLQTYLQLSGCLARLCKINMKPSVSGSFVARTVLKTLAKTIYAIDSSVPCQLWKT